MNGSIPFKIKIHCKTSQSNNLTDCAKNPQNTNNHMYFTSIRPTTANVCKFVEPVNDERECHDNYRNGDEGSSGINVIWGFKCVLSPWRVFIC